MLMERPLSIKNPRLLLAGCCLFFSAATFALAPLPSRGQAANSGVTPEVVQLYQEARAAQARGDFTAAIADYRQILASSRGLAPAYNNLGLIYYQLHEYDRAIKVLQQGLQIDPAMSGSWVLLGSSQLATRRYQDAVKSLKTALRRRPNDEQALLLLAHAQLHLGDQNGAVTTLDQLTKISPNSQEAWYLLGKTYLQMSQRAFTQVQKIDPDSSLSLVMSGEIMESMRNYKEALSAYQKAYALDPKSDIAQAHLANVYWELGDWEQAHKAFTEELQRDPADCSARWKAADCLLQQHISPDQALSELNQSIAECGDVMQARVDRARLLLQTGHPAQALPDLLMAEKADPGEPSIHFLLARVYASENLKDQAAHERQVYEKLQALASQKVADRASTVESVKAAPQ
jgi:tetratricopeptide (TPR) repeat protein